MTTIEGYQTVRLPKHGGHRQQNGKPNKNHLFSDPLFVTLSRPIQTIARRVHQTGQSVSGVSGPPIKEVQMGQRVAICCRVSTADQSCERQERDLLAFAERGGQEVVGIWKEVASGAKDQRPERKKVLALAQDRRIDAVLVTEMTRWGRSTQDLLTTLQTLQAWKVSLIAQTGLQFDMTTPQGKFIASMMCQRPHERDHPSATK